MLERDLTSPSSKFCLAKELDGWTWERVNDTPNRHRASAGFDGWLVKGLTALRVEVKIGNSPLTKSERKKAAECQQAGEPYLILRWWPKDWQLEVLGQMWQGSLMECLAGLENFLERG